MNSLSSSISLRLIKKERCISQAKPSIQQAANYGRLIHSSLLSQVINETSVYEREKKNGHYSFACSLAMVGGVIGQ